MKISGKKEWKRKTKKKTFFAYTDLFPKKQDGKNIEKKQTQFTKGEEIFRFHKSFCISAIQEEAKGAK